MAAHLNQSAKLLNIPGMIGGVVYRGKLIWLHSFGVRDVKTKEPVDAKTVFRIGSITKTFTGLAVLALRDAGKLRLDDPAAKYLPEISQVIYPTRDSPRITVRHLVSHTSGLPRMGKFDYTPANAKVTEASLLAGLRGLKLVAVPGTKTGYSNLGTALVGILIGRVSGKPYRDYVTSTILRPLSMKSTHWDRSAVPPKRLATGYVVTKTGLATKHHWRLGASEALGGIYSNLEDMARYVSYQLSAWPPSSLPQRGPVGRSSLRESHVSVGSAPPGGEAFALSWTPAHPRGLGFSVLHNGGTYQYSAIVWMLPKRGLGAIVLANCGGRTGENAFKMPAIGAGLLGLLLRYNQDPPPKLTPTLTKAIGEMKQLLDNPTEAALKRLAAPVLRHVPAAKVMAGLKKHAQVLGRCSGRPHKTLKRMGVLGARVLLQCEKGQAVVTIHLRSPNEVVLVGWNVTPKKP